MLRFLNVFIFLIGSVHALEVNNDYFSRLSPIENSKIQSPLVKNNGTFGASIVLRLGKYGRSSSELLDEAEHALDIIFQEKGINVAIINYETIKNQPVQTFLQDLYQNLFSNITNPEKNILILTIEEKHEIFIYSGALLKGEVYSEVLNSTLPLLNDGLKGQRFPLALKYTASFLKTAFPASDKDSFSFLEKVKLSFIKYKYKTTVWRWNYVENIDDLDWDVQDFVNSLENPFFEWLLWPITQVSDNPWAVSLITLYIFIYLHSLSLHIRRSERKNGGWYNWIHVAGILHVTMISPFFILFSYGMEIYSFQKKKNSSL